MNTVVISTRSMNRHLLGICHGLLSGLPYARRAAKGASAMGYLLGLLRLDAEWVVNIDEDAFVFDPGRIEALLAFMKRRRYACCGLPDGGVVPVRRHNPVVCNPFFNIMNLDRLRGAFVSAAEVKSARFRERFRRRVPSFARGGKQSFDAFEPYYPFFLWMIEKGLRPLFLRGTTWRGDGVSTILRDYEDNPFLIHAWNSREWGRKATKQRIIKVVRYCRGKVGR